MFESGNNVTSSTFVFVGSTDDINVSYGGSDTVNHGEGVPPSLTTQVPRKSKKSTLSRLFKPWKWRRKKKGASRKETKKSKGMK